MNENFLNPIIAPVGDVTAVPQRRVVELSDGYRTSVYVHAPAEVRHLPVIYIHGIQSHPAWYYASADALARAGHTVYQPTRRGSGDNAEARGHCKSPRQLFSDLDTVIDIACRENNCDKVVLLGVSWGGKMIAAYCLSSKTRAAKVASLVLVAPGLFSKIDVPLKTKFGIAGVLLTMPKKMFDIPLGDVELFTDNPPLREYLRSDEHQLRRATAKFMFTSRRLDSIISRAGDSSITCGVTLILSDDDRIIDNEKTVSWVERVCSGGEVFVIPGQHTMEFTEDDEIFHRYLQLLTTACQKRK